MTPTPAPASDIDLQRCAEEPIHIPGAIQPHGYLVAFDGGGQRLMQFSANLPELLGETAENLLGRSAQAVFGAPAAELLRQALDGEKADAPLRLELAGRLFDAALHRHQGLSILELEPAVSAGQEESTLWLGRTIQRLQAAASFESLREVVVREVREITGFDRVLLYRFDTDGHGQVWAEARADDVESYLGLHYPASDIPRQARELYRLNWLRLIPDAVYQPVPLLPERRPDNGRPLDLSFSLLRSVSPVHREYLQNMGLRASMSISLMKGDRLWGLISCGHRSPKFVPPPVRAACQTIGRLLSLQIDAFEELAERQLRDAKTALVATLTAAMRRPEEDVLLNLLQRPRELMELVGAGGVALCVQDQILTLGDSPTQAQVRALAEWALQRMPPDGRLATHQLDADFPPATAYRERASGLLAVSLPKPGCHLVLWFRPEEVETIGWGGNPHKAVEADPVGGAARLHPRRSFELWKEVVRGRSRRWLPGELHAAGDLRRFAIELDLARQVLREQEAVRARDDLVAVVSHDLRSPMSSVALQAAFINRMLLTETSESSMRLRAASDRIHGAVERMNRLLQDLLDLSKIEAGSFQISPQPQDVSLLLEDACAILAPLAEVKSVGLEHSAEPELRIQADAERMFQVLSNLIGNAIKFSSEGGHIGIRARREGGFALFSVRDQGVGMPPEQLPSIFERYWQARPGEGKGAGLGLYIARGIVEAHGGRIWAESAPGHGTTFFFTVPLAAG